MKRVLLLESQYLPPLEYFCALIQFEEVRIEIMESFTKQTYRNRCRIMGPNGPQNLVIPVSHKNRLMSEVLINYQEKWWKEHWRSIETAYNKSPYMLYYGDELKEIYFSKPRFLHELNNNLLSFCLAKLSVDVNISRSKAFKKDYSEEYIIDLRGKIHPKLDFSELGIYKSVEYYQQFGKAFEPNLSILDLLMMGGPESIDIIKSSIGVLLNK